MSQSEEESPEKTEANSEESAAIIVVDPDLASRNDAEDLEDDLDRQVIAMDSMEFEPESSEDILDASVFIISWDLGIRSGIDLVEEIRNDPRLEDKTILIATAEPTRELVCWAIALGADAVCLKPYDPEEIRTRLASLESRAAAAA